MYKETLRSIEGIQIYPLVSLVIFGLFFISLIIWVMRVDKAYLYEMSNLPLMDAPNSNIKKKGDSHV
jgi:fructose-specific phosphotransferase system IIC component